MGSQADQVRNDILGRVLARQLLPGDLVDEADLRDRLALSATPIREALISLEAAKVVHRAPRGGARIGALDLEGLLKMIESLAEVEGAVAYRAAQRINAEQAEALKAAVRACRLAADAPQPSRPAYYDLNLVFHRAMIDAGGNEHLGEVLSQLGNRLVAYLSVRHDLPGEVQRSAADHARICEAVLAANGERARELMVAHVMFGGTVALDVLNRVKSMSATRTRD